MGRRDLTVEAVMRARKAAGAHHYPRAGIDMTASHLIKLRGSESPEPALACTCTDATEVTTAAAVLARPPGRVHPPGARNPSLASLEHSDVGSLVDQVGQLAKCINGRLPPQTAHS